MKCLHLDSQNQLSPFPKSCHWGCLKTQIHEAFIHVGRGQESLLVEGWAYPEFDHSLILYPELQYSLAQTHSNQESQIPSTAFPAAFPATRMTSVASSRCLMLTLHPRGSLTGQRYVPSPLTPALVHLPSRLPVSTSLCISFLVSQQLLSCALDVPLVIAWLFSPTL